MGRKKGEKRLGENERGRERMGGKESERSTEGDWTGWRDRGIQWVGKDGGKVEKGRACSFQQLTAFCC